MTLSIRGVSAQYGPIEVCRGIDLEVHPGEAVVLTGPNGAGKTTLLRRIAGQVTGKGSISLDGQDIGRLPTSERSRRGLMFIPDSRGLFPALSVEDNLEVAGLLVPRSQRREALELVRSKFPVIVERGKSPVGVLSGGEQQIVALARVHMVRPRFVLFDEPSQGLAPKIVQQIGGEIKDLCALGTGVLLVEQNLKLAAAVADRVGLLIGGHILQTGGPELLDEKTLGELYLGSEIAEAR